MEIPIQIYSPVSVLSHKDSISQRSKSIINVESIKTIEIQNSQIFEQNSAAATDIPLKSIESASLKDSTQKRQSLLDTYMQMLNENNEDRKSI